MEIKFTIEYTAYFDAEQAEEDFYTIMRMHQQKGKEINIDTAIYAATEENISWPTNVDDLPNEVVESAATALRKQIGGIQMEMDLPPFPTLWWEDSVWKK